VDSTSPLLSARSYWTWKYALGEKDPAIFPPGREYLTDGPFQKILCLRSRQLYVSSDGGDPVLWGMRTIKRTSKHFWMEIYSHTCQIIV
jgi:hypothetical protein